MNMINMFSVSKICYKSGNYVFSFKYMMNMITMYSVLNVCYEHVTMYSV